MEEMFDIEVKAYRKQPEKRQMRLSLRVRYINGNFFQDPSR
jgi:hypothetical protein